MLFEHDSGLQTISLEATPREVTLYLDGYFQFSTRTEAIYHSFLITLPLTMAREARRILIMGGGDGLALRDALQMGVDQAVLVELDPKMIALASRPPISDINQRSFFDPRAKVIVGDAKKWIDQLPARYFDVIAADFPAATSPELTELYSPDFWDRVLSRLAPGGVFSCQISEEFTFLKESRKFLESRLGYALGVVTQPQRIETQAFVYGSSGPFRIRRDAPAHSPVAPLLAGIDTQLQRGKKVISYHPARRPFYAPA